MSDLSAHQQMNKKLDSLFDAIVAGRTDASVGMAAAAIAKERTRRGELQLKQAIRGKFVKRLTPQWMAEQFPPPVPPTDD